MIDLRETKTIDLKEANCLKEQATFQYIDSLTGKKLIAKFIAYYDDKTDEYLITEFRKLALLSAEPEIGTVYFLATGDFGDGPKSCYVMDFIEGPTLGKFLELNDSVQVGFVVDFLHQLSTGIEKAHHYEISHGDLHEENIMIDKFNYVKIIDFLWWDLKLPFEQNQKEDVSSFKKLLELLVPKLSEKDMSIFKIVHDYLLQIESFKDVGYNISILNNVSVDLSLIDELSTHILSVIISSISEEANLMYMIEEQGVEIPEQYIPELTEQDQKFMDSEKNGKIKLKHFDSRGGRLHDTLNSVFNLKLHQLKQAGFIDWEFGVQNQGEKFIGPYTVAFRIFFTVKLFQWKKLNEQFKFLPTPEKTLGNLILNE